MSIRLSARLLLLTTASCCPAALALAQVATGQVAGKVVDAATGRPAPYATVAVLGPAGAVVSAGTGSPDGRFVLAGIPAGTYTLKVSLLGYKELVRPGVVVAASSALELGALAVQPAASQLGDVTVTARRPRVDG